jgi:hypothetical protein
VLRGILGPMRGEVTGDWWHVALQPSRLTRREPHMSYTDFDEVTWAVLQ